MTRRPQKPRHGLRPDARNEAAARRECAQLAAEVEQAPTPPGYCRRCKVTRLSRDDRSGLCGGCADVPARAENRTNVS